MKKFLLGPNGVLTASGKALSIDEVPSGYKKLQYISSAGKSAVDTLIEATATDTIFMTFEISNLSDSGDKFMVSCKAGYSGGGIWAETYGNTNKWYVRYGSSSSASGNSSSSQLTGIHTLELRKDYFGLDGTKILTPNYSSMPSTTVNFVGRMPASGKTVSTGFRGKVYDTQIVNSSGDKIWWGIPVLEVASNKAGLYDLVSDTFFKSDSSVDFTAGPELI